MIDKYLITSDYSVKETIEKMNKEVIKAVVIVDNDQRVLGLFSNGDMRRYFLKGGSLEEKITAAMNFQPKLYYSYEDIEKERGFLKRVLYPLVNDERILVDIVDYERTQEGAIVSDVLKKVPLVIMAGGKGTRLYPYTKILPKPLIPIGEVSITEKIIYSFQRYGCDNVIMILNYKEGIIKAYFNDLKKNYQLEYVTEKEFLGTAGGLKYLSNKVNSTFFLSNCDIIVNGDLECAYKTHKKNNNVITMICSMKSITIPYGVVETDEEGNITSMEEKPGLSYLINTGIYIIEPEAIQRIGDNEFIGMPDLIERCKENGDKVGVFPISEDEWMDMGQMDEMNDMKNKLGIL